MNKFVELFNNDTTLKIDVTTLERYINTPTMDVYNDLKQRDFPMPIGNTCEEELVIFDQLLKEKSFGAHLGDGHNDMHFGGRMYYNSAARIDITDDVDEIVQRYYQDLGYTSILLYADAGVPLSDNHIVSAYIERVANGLCDILNPTLSNIQHCSTMNNNQIQRFDTTSYIFISLEDKSYYHFYNDVILGLIRDEHPNFSVDTQLLYNRFMQSPQKRIASQFYSIEKLAKSDTCIEDRIAKFSKKIKKNSDTAKYSWALDKFISKMYKETGYMLDRNNFDETIDYPTFKSIGIGKIIGGFTKKWALLPISGTSGERKQIIEALATELYSAAVKWDTRESIKL